MKRLGTRPGWGISSPHCSFPRTALVTLLVFSPQFGNAEESIAQYGDWHVIQGDVFYFDLAKNDFATKPGCFVGSGQDEGYVYLIFDEENASWVTRVCGSSWNFEYSRNPMILRSGDQEILYDNPEYVDQCIIALTAPDRLIFQEYADLAEEEQPIVVLDWEGRELIAFPNEGGLPEALSAARGGLQACAPADDSTNATPPPAPISPISVADRGLDQLSPYREADRWQTYRVTQSLFFELFQSGSGTQVGQGESDARLFEETHYLVLFDQDDDGGADFFAYFPTPEGGDTYDFGAVFDLNTDGRVDWLVFYGGEHLTAEPALTRWTQHLVDRNSDGKFDLHITELVDIDGDGWLDLGVTGWVYDDDFDQKIDRAERNIDGTFEPVPPDDDGVLDLGHLLWTGTGDTPKIGDELPQWSFEIMVADIHTLIGK